MTRFPAAHSKLRLETWLGLTHNTPVSKTLTAFAFGCAGIAVSAAAQAFAIEHWHIVLFGTRLATIPYGAVALALVPTLTFGFSAEFLGVRPGTRIWLGAFALWAVCVFVFIPLALHAILSGSGHPYIAGHRMVLGRWWDCLCMVGVFGWIAYNLQPGNYCEPCERYFKSRGMRRYRFTTLKDCLDFYGPLWDQDLDIPRLKAILAQNRSTHYTGTGASEAVVSLLYCPKCQQLRLFGKVLQKQGGEMNVVENLTRQRFLGHRIPYGASLPGD